MYAPTHHFFLALAQARKAARRGDIAAAERWTALAERFTRISQRLEALTDAEAKRRSPRNPLPAYMRD
jgi:hypothetical protein